MMIAQNITSFRSRCFFHIFTLFILFFTSSFCFHSNDHFLLTKQHRSSLHVTRRFFASNRDNNVAEINTSTSSSSLGWSLLEQSIQSLSLTNEATRQSLFDRIQSIGFGNAIELQHFARDFRDRPEILSKVLQKDFGFGALESHQARMAIMNMLVVMESDEDESEEVSIEKEAIVNVNNDNNKEEIIQSDAKTKKKTKKKRNLFKSVIVNHRAKQRKSDPKNEYYGLPNNYDELYPVLSSELNEFYRFMTQPSSSSQETPIRHATADVYLRHAKLFLGWYIHHHDESNSNNNNQTQQQQPSIYQIIPDKSRHSSSAILSFLMFLRNNRQISKSYEANLLRGLLKLVKFRFANESEADPTYGEKPFEDIPLIRELRKWHREADKHRKKTGRSSDESMKWITWNEYLRVVKCLKQELDDLRTNDDEEEDGGGSTTLATKRKIAIAYQHYLILAFFSCVPDRQRTIRELELNKTLFREKDQYVIKHGPDDYKTGKTYGDRPPLFLASHLTPSVDDFVANYRTIALKPTTPKLFVQPRTGNPMTRDSIYQIVSRCCFRHAGKRTNPHLLRDMIVTHVRDSDATEKELESLALYMGHSIEMQRESYDRRTMGQKVKPAVELLKNVNDEASS